VYECKEKEKINLMRKHRKIISRVAVPEKKKKLFGTVKISKIGY